MPARIARDLGMAGVIVPLYPGVFSAIGLLMSDVKHDYVQSKMDPIAALAPADVEEMFSRLAAQAVADLRADGFGEGQIDIQRALDMRYAGQGYEITIPCDAAAGDADGLARLRASFDAQHKSMFGHTAPDEPVEIVSYRVRGLGKVPPVEMPRFSRTGTTLADARRGDAARALRRRDGRLPGLSAREARRRPELDGAGDPRSVRLHDGDLPGPGGAGGRVEEFDRDGGGDDSHCGAPRDGEALLVVHPKSRLTPKEGRHASQ